MAERLLKHGTADRLVLGVIARREPLIGNRFPSDPSRSGTLTNSYVIARYGALEKIIWVDRAKPVILHYRVPEDVLIDHGAIGGNNGELRAYSTTIVAYPEEIPKAYLEGLSLTQEVAAKRIADNTMLFF